MTSALISLCAFLNLNEQIGKGRISKACLIYSDSSWNKSVPWVIWDWEFGIVWCSLRMNFWWGWFHCLQQADKTMSLIVALGGEEVVVSDLCFVWPSDQPEEWDKELRAFTWDFKKPQIQIWLS